MKKSVYNKVFILLLMGIMPFAGCTQSPKNEPNSLKDALNGKFYIGAALNISQVAGKDSMALRLINKHFNSVVAENCMKMESLQPEEGIFTFDDADAFVKFGEEHNMKIIGHNLVWHSQAPQWMFTDKNGQEVTRDVLIERMRNHIQTIVTRYKGRVAGWDVVNEAILDNGQWRESPWYKIIGPEFIRMAFEFAHAADPEAELYYNDYSVYKTAKTDGIYNLVVKLKEEGVRIDGVGMQGHIDLNNPTVAEMEAAIVKLSQVVDKIMITELDMSVLPWPGKALSADISLNYDEKSEYNPYPDSLPDSISAKFNQRYADFFALFLKHQDKVDRVTMWGVEDGQSWRNYWPVPGRKDYPLLFDRNYQPKPIVGKIIEMAQVQQ
ncbi:endo-1,4-beta-xylanase [Geofilum sp. OHC36d9]|uniref:endo-1,4-beta-xylanase n=1 Tax=Geofilum sp. OHC36d9 TaxID=3458413 RepID=UPI00403398ED